MKSKGKAVEMLPVVAGAAIGLFLASRLGVSADGYPLDDAWIHLDYARSLTENFTFGHTPGTWENGSTSPLWSVLLSGPLVLGIPVEFASKLLGLTALVLTTLLVYRVGAHVGGPVVGTVASTAVACDPWIGVLSVSGMEPVAATAAGFAAMAAVQRGRLRTAGLTLAAAGLLRPELGVLVPLVAIGAWLYPHPGSGKSCMRTMMSVTLPPVLAGVFWVLYGLMTTGLPLPNTFYVKTDTGVALASQLDALRALFLSGPHLAVAVAIVLMILGLAHIFWQERRRIPLLVLPPAVVIAFYVVALPLGGDYGPLSPGSAENVYFARYPLVVVPWLALWSALGGQSLWRFVHGQASRFGTPAAKALATIMLIAVATVVAIPWQRHRGTLAEAYRANSAEIQRVQVKMAREIDEKLPSSAVIGVSDAGALRYFTRQRMIDLAGLNSHEMIRASDPVAWLIDEGLTHLVVWPHWHPELLGDPRLSTRQIGFLGVGRPTIVPAASLLVLEVRTDPAASSPRSGDPSRSGVDR